MLGIGKKLSYYFRKSPEIIGYKKKRSFEASVNKILKDFDPKGFGLRP